MDVMSLWNELSVELAAEDGLHDWEMPSGKLPMRAGANVCSINGRPSAAKFPRPNC